MYKFAVIALVISTLAIGGCSTTKETLKQGADKTSQPDLIALDPNYRAAMDHFIDGNLNDVVGDYANAILDYQDALRHYRAPAILDAMAHDYVRLGKSEIAIGEARQAVDLSPDNINYRRTLAQAYLSVFNIDSARVQFSKILSIDSTQVGDMLVLAQLYQKDDPKEAAALYERALNLTGPDLPTMMQLVQLYNSTEQYDKSIRVIKEMIQVDPTNMKLKEMLSRLYLQTGKNADAISVLDRLMKEDTSDFNLKALAATAYLRMNDFAHADSLLDTIFTSDSSRADAKFAIGQFYLDEMRRDSAVIPFAEQIFHRLLALYPGDARSYLMAGLGASYANNDSLAEKYLEKSVEIDSTNQNAWEAIAVFYFQHNDFSKMADAMSRAVRIFPDDFRINLFYGLALNRSGDNADAVKPLKEAVSLKPTDMDALSTLALVYESLNRYDDAYRIYETALKVDGKNSLILNNYAYSLSERGLHLHKALEMARLAVDLDPSNSAYLDTMGWVYYKLADYKRAEMYVEKALSMRKPSDGSPATLEEHLGDIYAKMGKEKQAVEHWKKALQLDPGNESIKEKIAKVKI
ncbi:MAG: tetratricopeptide repeat protein [Bacteroidetes bacterium]|nr:tetratricopeptide repeat protein [Bacteroidota bacterium]